MSAQDDQEKLRIANIIASAKNFADQLKDQGVSSYVLSVALSENPEGDGHCRMEGNSTLILNMVGAQVKALRPEDFKRLIGVMMFGDYFWEQREAIGMNHPPANTTVQ